MTKPGDQLASVVCATTVVVVRPPNADTVFACGGQPMRDATSELTGVAGEADKALCNGTQLGKRYLDEATGAELLCVSGGEGSLTCNGVPMTVAGAKPLPSSD